MAVLLSLVLVAAHEEDEKQPKQVGPTMQTVTEENFHILLSAQLSENIKDPKKHKPLLLALVSREQKGTLEFSRDFRKLADTTFRQFTLALGDCHFERAVCLQIRPQIFPALYLF